MERTVRVLHLIPSKDHEPLRGIAVANIRQGQATRRLAEVDREASS